MCGWDQNDLEGEKALWAQQQRRLVQRKGAAADSESKTGFGRREGFRGRAWTCCVDIKESSLTEAKRAHWGQLIRSPVSS